MTSEIKLLLSVAALIAVIIVPSLMMAANGVAEGPAYKDVNPLVQGAAK